MWRHPYFLRILSNGTLVIEKSQASHEGHYLCKADNGVVHGSTLSKLAEIKVNGRVNIMILPQVSSYKIGSIIRPVVLNVGSLDAHQS